MKIKDRIAKLIDVKSIMSLLTIIVFAILALKGRITPENTMNVIMLVVAFYFGVQSTKNDKEEK